jgi:hypothetical protein
MARQRSFPTLRDQSLVAKANCRFRLLDDPFLRVSGVRGTIDCWFTMGSSSDAIVLSQSVASSSTAPLINVAVNATGQATGYIQNVGGATVAFWDATSMATHAAGALIHMQFAWDSTAPIHGLYHAKVIVDGVVMPATDFTTPPLTTWVPFQPTYLTTGTFTETGYDGDMILTQASLKVVI